MSVDNLSKVEAAQQAVLKKTHGGKAGAQFVQEVKESILFNTTGMSFFLQLQLPLH